MKKSIFLFAALPVVLLVSIVSAVSYSWFDITAQFSTGETVTTTLQLDPTNQNFTATLESTSAGVFAHIIGDSFSTMIPITSTLPVSTTLTVTATLPANWGINGFTWVIPYDSSSLTITVQPTGANVVPAPSSLLLTLTGVILLTGLLLKKRLFTS